MPAASPPTTDSRPLTSRSPWGRRLLRWMSRSSPPVVVLANPTERVYPDPMGRPRSFDRVRRLPVVGRVADWGMGPQAVSKATRRAGGRIAGLKATESICPYCAVGCGQVVYTRGGELVDIEGNPRSPISQGTLCPKGSASRQLIQQPGRLTKVRYRPPGGTRVGGSRARDGDGHDRRAGDRGT